MPEEPHADVLQRLEAAIEEWNVELRRAHASLADRLARAQERLEGHAAHEEPAGGAASAGGEGASATGALWQEFDALRGDVAALEQRVEGSIAASNAAMGRLDELQARFSELSRVVDAHQAYLEMLVEQADVPSVPPEASGEAPAAETGGERASPAGAPGPPGEAYVDLEGRDAEGRRRRFGDILLAAGLVTAEQLEAALAVQGASGHRRLGEILVEQGFADETTIARVLGAQLGMRVVWLSTESIDETAAGLLEPRLARRHGVLPLALRSGRLTLAMANPLDIIAIDDVALAAGYPVDPVIATPSDIAEAIETVYGENASAG
jgi:hypothetical protein